ncbi:hypothetical protein KAW38_04320 [Candidatus Micrarchaeota archaeon]|nr:hypothetical protein [Candidatus Micrarchaeota archaeon]
MRVASKEGEIGLDNGKGDYSFLSHAHGDHLRGIKKAKNILSSDETAEMAGVKNSGLPKGIKLHDAGHILGARQIAIENGKKTVYTGDFRTEKDIFGHKAEIIECDELIIEATYGNPAFRFPALDDVYSGMQDFIRKNKNNIVLFGAYSLGKTQEIIKIVNEVGGVPVVEENSERFNRVYEKFGKKLERAVIGSEKAEEAMKGPFVGIIKPNLAKKTFGSKLEGAFGRKVVTAAASGWVQRYRFNTDVLFPLSDHEDFYGIIEYIREANPKKVRFVHGEKKHLENEMSKEGIEVMK